MNKLFPVIRTAFAISTPFDTPTIEECEELINFGRKQSILPVIYAGLKKTELPADFLKAIDRQRNTDLRSYILQTDSLKKIEAALNKTGISYILLKGAVLRHLYPAPEMRTCCDIDILVHESDFDRALNAIETYTDFKTSVRDYHSISLMNQSVHLELHHSIKENEESIDKALSCAWNYAEPVEGSKYTFTPEYQVFYVAAHMSYHFSHGGLGIRPFLDLWLLRNKTEFDEEATKEICRQCGILKFYEECCNLTDVWLGDSEHTETTEMLEEFCLSGGVYGNREFKNAGRQRGRRGLKYIFSRVFPSAYQVREYYSSASEERHSLFFYYVKRLISWLRRRKELNRQIVEIMSSDQQYIDKTDELFRRLDMA